MWPEQEKTLELLEEARGGNGDAVDRLFSRHRAALRRMISFQLDRRLRRRVDASDIVQDVLVEASRRLTDYLRDPVMPFHLWLRQLARDHMIAAHRRHRVAKKRTLDRERSLNAAGRSDRSSVDLAAQIVARGVTPATAAIRKELEERFLDALASLSEADREIIGMRHFEQLSNQETAQALGITEPAAGMRYLRAMRRLRKSLGEEP